jgi:hypothetical protein
VPIITPKKDLFRVKRGEVIDYLLLVIACMKNNLCEKLLQKGKNAN